MSLKSIDLKEVKAIVDWVNVTQDIHEFSLKFGDLELFVSRNKNASGAPPAASIAVVPLAAAPSASTAMPSAASAVPVPVPVPAPAAAPATAKPSVLAVALAADDVLIKAPMVGTFYAGPKPGAPNFVSVGDAVSPETVLCIVEVMKLMNNIESGVEGRVTQIFVQNEQPVEYGQPLMIIKKRG